MNVLVISDIHSSFKRLKKILSVASDESSFCFACGDITHFRSQDIFEFDKLLRDFGFECIAVHGNCDPPDTLDLFEETEINLIHRKSVKFKGFTLHGIGGSNYTPFFTPCEYSEDEIRGFTKNFSYGEKNILISHCPPFGILDRTYGQVNAGCVAIREILSSFDAVFCGHIHEARGIHGGIREGNHGGTHENPLVVNPGNANSGYFAIFNFDDFYCQLREMY